MALKMKDVPADGICRYCLTQYPVSNSDEVLAAFYNVEMAWLANPRRKEDRTWATEVRAERYPAICKSCVAAFREFKGFCFRCLAARKRVPADLIRGGKSYCLHHWREGMSPCNACGRDSPAYAIANSGPCFSCLSARGFKYIETGDAIDWTSVRAKSLEREVARLAVFEEWGTWPEVVELLARADAQGKLLRTCQDPSHHEQSGKEWNAELRLFLGCICRKCWQERGKPKTHLDLPFKTDPDPEYLAQRAREDRCVRRREL